VRSIEHGHALRQYMPGAVFMEGDTPATERKQILDQVRNRRLNTLIATSLADEGLDLPSVDVVILAGAGSSTTKALQRIGRALRPFPVRRRRTSKNWWTSIRLSRSSGMSARLSTQRSLALQFKK
jgi:superfamily II DNA or RNA helicase